MPAAARALALFHVRAGSRLCLRAFAPVVSVVVAAVGLQEDPDAALGSVAAALGKNRLDSLAAVAVPFGYREGQVVLRDADLAVGKGLTLLLGPNGSGKSTLLKLVSGVERPHAGPVLIDGIDLWREETAARRRLAYVPEQPDLTPYATLEEVLQLVCRLRGEPRSCARERLASCGLDGFARRSIRELSLGQRRRALVAAARVGEPPVLVLDDPLEALDVEHRDEVLAWLERRISGGALAFVATHDTTTFAALASSAATLRAGRPFLLEPLPAAPAERLEALAVLARHASHGEGAPRGSEEGVP